MTMSDYVAAESAIHRLAPGIKILALALTGTLLFVFPRLECAIAALSAIVLGYPLAHIPARTLLLQLKPLLWLLLLLFAVQWWMVSWQSGLLVVIRLSALMLMAALVTLTTRTSALIEALEKGLFWLRYMRINPAKISLALALALRFIPVLAAITLEVREAQRARGLDNSILAVAVPVMVRTLKMADDIAAALEARAYDPQPQLKT
ncbi:energy-coupling factor transporter transmembrane component T family protein [Erwinia amylovora]|uniref:energy-coupling factor transporter transmembrane component T family protein n=1 Tax=Erwinia amylovora TaxID=552 RepID=UPI0020C10230|nr:energy-coupling factor transporter transmembrane protein EcfT [Erwinia amylovora]MCK8204769.1 energy-coupling factor transporter transmembrane protein EcfT [Erwinia amylovora]MCK8275578.1 energy-coupling factor transporter transmembrane protein EcfT [Erwinia amylovora]MCK8285702.1 energy-coupling factor transporter transmembrane protein EcfT [Erwinia amylovora]MCK8322451.1 energy-coupling factor transporter transmembrane protein EcfT [Erwinia amylovora]MCK8403921.1 energy-coupling factor tr